MLWLSVAVAVYLLLLLAVGWASIHPYRIPIFFSPGAIGAPQEEVTFTSSDGVPLRAWWIDARGATSVVVLAHGYFMNRSELAPVAGKLYERGVSCLVIDFRAHGLTKVGKSTLGWRERLDIRAAVEYARTKVPGAKVAVIGSSMGSAATALAWGEDPSLLDAAVLDSCYSRLSSATLGWWRFLGGRLLAFLLGPTVVVAGAMIGVNPFKIDISKVLHHLQDKPVLLLHGERDDLALPSEARRNLQALGPDAQIVWFPGCGHSEGRWLYPDLYYTSLFEFLEKANLLQPPAPR